MTDQILLTYFLSTVSPHTAWEHCGCKPLTQLSQQAGWHSEVLYAMLRRELRSPPHQNLRDSQQPGRKKEQSVPIPVLFQASMLQSKASFGLLVVQLTLVIYWTFPPYILLSRWYSVLCLSCVKINLFKKSASTRDNLAPEFPWVFYFSQFSTWEGDWLFEGHPLLFAVHQYHSCYCRKRKQNFGDLGTWRQCSLA